MIKSLSTQGAPKHNSSHNKLRIGLANSEPKAAELGSTIKLKNRGDCCSAAVAPWKNDAYISHLMKL